MPSVIGQRFYLLIMRAADQLLPREILREAPAHDDVSFSSNLAQAPMHHWITQVMTCEPRRRLRVILVGSEFEHRLLPLMQQAFVVMASALNLVPSTCGPLRAAFRT